MKKSVFISVITLIAIAVQAQEFTLGELHYRVTDSSTPRVEVIRSYETEEGYSSMRVVHIPATVNYDGVTYEVTSIEALAFASSDKLEEITLPRTLKSIGSYAFSKCEKLASITFPEGLQRIGSHAFAENNSLTSVTIPTSVTSIEENAFIDCMRLQYVVWNAINCTTTTSPVFMSDSNIVSFTFGNSVQSIPLGICYALPRLESVTLPNSVIKIEDYAFCQCPELKSVRLSSALKEIGAFAFNECPKLKSITFPNGLERIGNRAFDGDHALTEIIIPESVTFVDGNAFQLCNGLRSVVWNAIECSATTYPVFFADTNIISFKFGKYVKNIPYGLCSNLSGIQSVVLPNTITKIDSIAFYRCTGLKEIVLSNATEEIAYHAFDGCTALTHITIPENVKVIGKDAFANCDSLRLVTWNTDMYKPITKAKTNTNTEDDEEEEEDEEYDDDKNFIFGYKNNIRSFVFGQHVKTIPENICYQLNDLDEVTFLGDVQKIEQSAFSHTNIHSITLPHSLEHIGEYAFAETQLSAIDISVNLKEIGLSAFIDAPISVIHWNARACRVLDNKDMKWPYTIFGEKTDEDDDSDPEKESNDNIRKIQFFVGDSVIDLPKYMFHKATFEKVVLGKNVRSVGFDTFRSSTYHEAIYNSHIFVYMPHDYSGTYELPDGLEAIADEAFAECAGLTGIRIPKSVLLIGKYAFYKTGLSSIFIPKNVNDIGYRAFSDCEKLSEIKVDKNNPIYDSRDNCNALMHSETNTLITGCCNSTIPSSTQVIGAFAFANCAGCLNINLSDNVEYIDDYAFITSNIQSVYIGKNVIYIGDMAFAGCRNLSKIQVDPGNKLYSSGKKHNMLVSNFDKQLIVACANAQIPDYIRIIGSHALLGSSSRSLVIPDNVIEIRDYAFAYCDQLQKIRFGKNVQLIGEGAFYGCPQLKEVTIPESVTDIGDYAFAFCESLRKCTIKGISSFATSWFSGCYNLHVTLGNSSIYINRGKL